jgi:hypothetical protein
MNNRPPGVCPFFIFLVSPSFSSSFFLSLLSLVPQVRVKFLRVSWSG